MRRYNALKTVTCGVRRLRNLRKYSRRAVAVFVIISVTEYYFAILFLCKGFLGLITSVRMPRKREKKTDRGSKDLLLYEEAYQEIKNCRSIRAAMFDLCHVSLLRYKNKKMEDPAVRRLAYDLAIKYNLKKPESWDRGKMADTDWFSDFVKRNPELSIRCAQATSHQLATSFNRTNVDAFLNNYEKVMEKDHFEPQNIYNMDETGITTVQKPDRILTRNGAHQVRALTSRDAQVLQGSSSDTHLEELVQELESASDFMPQRLEYSCQPQESVTRENSAPRERSQLLIASEKDPLVFTSEASSRENSPEMVHKKKRISKNKERSSALSSVYPLEMMAENIKETEHRTTTEPISQRHCTPSPMSSHSLPPYQPASDSPDSKTGASGKLPISPDHMRTPLQQSHSNRLSTSKFQDFSPEAVCPFPKAPPRKLTNRGRKENRQYILLTPRKSRNRSGRTRKKDKT
ncbi:hypothetical protein EVAR_85981_1 [Eumeta japonica]|uniref:HTH CENPB-type domain-containing protein n=1 Tax=Eumeta variegata TaxID=151549 RepID=A0A4C1UJH9_EUMVA|nr:hypothetical protein EVAR_85981_1 [Eumeta japonica]